MALQVPVKSYPPNAFAQRLRRRSARSVDGHAEWLRDIAWTIREREARYRHLLDSQDDIILRLDDGGRVTFANAAVFATFPGMAKSVPGACFTPTVLSGSWPVSLQGYSPLQRQRFELELETAHGPRWFDFEENVVSAALGRFETQLVGRDVTERQAQAAALAEARDLAEAANRAKSRFLAAMSHEIRTPMNGILGMGELLRDTDLSADQLTYISAIGRSARTLLALIDEILDFSKIEAGKLTLEARTYNLEDCVQSIVELLAPKAAEKGLELAWSIDPSLPELVIGDETRLQQILTNLLGNAVKFTDRGGVCVTVGAEGRGPDATGLRLAISVSDTGAGLTSETQSRIFSEFERGEAPTQRQHGGTGLGLAISRRLARAMGGDISVTSRAGEGATFKAVVELARVKHSRPLRTPHDGGGDIHILLVGLGRQESTALRLTFEGAHLPVECVSLADAARMVGGAAAACVPFSVVIVDGGAAVAELSPLLAAVASTSARMLAACDPAQKATFDAFRAVGVNGYVSRPMRPSSLLAQVIGQSRVRVSRHSARPLVRSPAAVTSSVRPLRVLLAEDNDINALVARRMLEQAGCEVQHVVTGRDAVDHVLAALEPHAERLDLVLMDMHMPVMDGIEATREIRRQLAGRDIAGPHIVALTANAFAEDRARCLAAGMDDYLAKPFERHEFNALLVRLREQTG